MSELTPGERAELEKLRAEKNRGVFLKVAKSGGVSLYGLQRYPTTLYKEQWETLLGMADEIQEFINDNDHKLKVKE
jgi:hypothetical protein